MKKLSVLFITVLIIVAMLQVYSHAALVDNLDGTIAQTRNDGSILMWLKDANYAYTSGYCSIPGNCYEGNGPGTMLWYEANDWIDYLNSTNHLGYNDWRLASALNSDGSGPCIGQNCNDSEMGYLYYIEGVTTSTPKVFDNLQSWAYWYAEEASSDSAWYFHFPSGDQGNEAFKINSYNAWAVRTVPEPISSALFIVGGATLGFRRYWKKKRST